MKNFFPPFAKLVALAACALTLGSCSRSEYAMLPKGSSYHGVTRVATPVPAATSETASAPTAEPIVAAAPVVVAEPKPAAPVLAANAPVAKTAARVATSTDAVQVPAVVATAPKLNLVQRLALAKVTRKMDKLMQKSGSVRQHDSMASTARGGISGNLRTGLILLLVGLLVGLLIPVVGYIIAIIGLVFIILWLLDQA